MERKAFRVGHRLPRNTDLDFDQDDVEFARRFFDRDDFGDRINRVFLDRCDRAFVVDADDFRAGGSMG